MLWRTHMVGGLIAGTLVAPHIINGDFNTQALFVACAGVGALLPDIDSVHSKLGRVFLPVSAPLAETGSFMERIVFVVLVFAEASLLIPIVRGIV